MTHRKGSAGHPVTDAGALEEDRTSANDRLPDKASAPQDQGPVDQLAADPFNWRDHLKVHPAADLFPLLPEDELKELAEDIKAHGLQVPLVMWTSPDPSEKYEALLDGRNRLDAAAMAGLLTVVDDGLRIRTERYPDGERLQLRFSLGDPYELVLSLNIHRRHLTPEQRRELVAKLLKAKPEASNLSIAKQVKIDDKTVAKVRAVLERRSEIPNVKVRTDRKGRKQPSAKPPRKAEWSGDLRLPEAPPLLPPRSSAKADRRSAPQGEIAERNLETTPDLVDQCVANVSEIVERAIDELRRSHASQERFDHLFEALSATIADLIRKNLSGVPETNFAGGGHD
jgi:hypothetical protein